jgi:hypothetical protein
MPNRKNAVPRGVNRSSRASPSGSSPRSVSPVKKQAQAAAIALAKKKQKEAEKEKRINKRRRINAITNFGKSVSRTAPIYLLEIVVGEERKKRRKKIPPRKICWMILKSRFRGKAMLPTTTGLQMITRAALGERRINREMKIPVLTKDCTLLLFLAQTTREKRTLKGMQKQKNKRMEQMAMIKNPPWLKAG